MTPAFSPETDRVLRASGWFPGRAVDTTQWTRPFEPRGVVFPTEVRRFLGQFGGLHIDVSGPGITCARAPFVLDPLLCLGEEDRFTEWGEELDIRITPIGELDRDRLLLGMDEHGTMYSVVNWVTTYGPWPDALNALITGRTGTDIA